MKNAEYKRVVSVCGEGGGGREFKRKRKHDIAVFIARDTGDGRRKWIKGIGEPTGKNMRRR